MAIAESLDTYGVWRTAGVFRDYATATRAYDLGSLSDLYSRGITIDGRTYSLDERDEALIKNSEMTDYFVSGKALTPFVGDGAAVWEAFPGVYSAFGGGYDPEAVAEVVTIRGGEVVREDFHWVAGPSRKAGEKGPHPARVRGPLGPADTAAAARRIGLAYAAGMEAKDATRMAQMSAPGVAFLDVGYGDAGGRSALLRRYARMFRFPDDLALRSRLVASGPGGCDPVDGRQRLARLRQRRRADRPGDPGRQGRPRDALLRQGPHAVPLSRRLTGIAHPRPILRGSARIQRALEGAQGTVGVPMMQSSRRRVPPSGPHAPGPLSGKDLRHEETLARGRARRRVPAPVRRAGVGHLFSTTPRPTPPTFRTGAETRTSRPPASGSHGMAQSTRAIRLRAS